VGSLDPIARLLAGLELHLPSHRMMRGSDFTMRTVLMAAALAAITTTGLPIRSACAQAQPLPTSAQISNQNPAGGENKLTPSVATSNISESSAAQFESSPILSLPEIFARQWMPRTESVPTDTFSLLEDDQSHKVTLKETIFLALRNNPGLGSVALDPVAATESVTGANAVFDPQISSQLDVQKQANAVSSPFQNPGSDAIVQKLYDWNFGLSKVLSYTNGTLGLTFNNDRELTNTAFSPVNPVYTPTIVMSLSQPLLQSFGWNFATINVRLAESAQRASQLNYASSINDFVQRIGNDYWGVVQADANLKVQQAALLFNNDLVRVNRANVRMGMLAKVNLTEALSAAATALANVRAAQAAVDSADTTLRQDVAYNPQDALIAQHLEPAQEPDVNPTEEGSGQAALKKMLQSSPALAGMRESIRSALIQVQYAENQTLPQLNLGMQFGFTNEAGNSKCTATISVPSTANCFDPTGPTVPPGANNAAELPFSGGYGSALNKMFDFAFYDYAAVFGFSMPLDNAAPEAALAQAQISLNQTRLQYRQALYQGALQVKSAFDDLVAYQQQVEATAEATSYAQESLHDVRLEFREGTATTNQLLQYQSNLVAAQNNEVLAQVGLENGRLALWHAEGTLLEHFNINFQVRNPHQTPWYSRF
jgi:outer membrane protein